MSLTTALYLLGLQGLVGAFDTLYYHEWKARLPALGSQAARELLLHAARDFLYGVLFVTLPWLSWKGRWTGLLVAFLGSEIILTLWDFVVEISVRKELGDVYAGERVTHAIMGVLYGAMLACLAPTLVDWWHSGTALSLGHTPVPTWIRLILGVMGCGVFASGLRDFYAALELPGGGWPWRVKETPSAEAGFTLLELIIASSILLILSSAALPVVRYTIIREKEFELRRDLRQMRDAIDRYKDYTDRGLIRVEVGSEGYPADLATLVKGVNIGAGTDQKMRFLRRIPKDPTTGRAEWDLRAVQDDPDATSWGGQNVFDVHSKSQATALDGTKYSDW